MKLSKNDTLEKPKDGKKKFSAILEKHKITGKKKVIIIAAAILLIIVIIAIIKSLSGNSPERVFNEVKVTKGNIQTSISGTAIVEANEQYEVTALVQGEIIGDYFEEGQEIEKGDILYQIDTTDAQNSVDKAKLNLQKSQNSYNNSANDLNKLNVSAKNGGTITNMYVDLGDSVAANTKICDIIDSSVLTIKIPFIAEDAANIYTGEEAMITLGSSGQILSGTVTRVGTGDITNSFGVIVRYIDISVNNPGSLTEGEEAVVTVGNYACQDSGTLKYKSSETVTAEVSGTVSRINKDLGDYVSAGTTIVTLTSESLSESVNNSKISLMESQLSLQNTEDMLDDYTITAPISGTVIQKTSKVGDTMDNSNSTTVMCVIADYSRTTISLNIDELDLSDVSVGQKVKIEADAFPGVEYSGYVDYISKVGTSSMGATSFPVTIVIENPENLIAGMNVSAEIITSSAENVLTLPQSAVNRGNIVLVKKSDVPDDAKLADENMTSRLDIPDDYVAIVIETGLTDGSNTEVKSGLPENATVGYYTIQMNSSGESQSGGNAMNGMMGGGGMPGGGMPGGGGMPSGGGMPGGMR